MRTKIVAANWKMNLDFSQAEELISEIVDSLDSVKGDPSKIVICPPFPFLEMARELTFETGIRIGAQNVSNHEKGAYTGEVSATMLKSLDLDCCIVGHSERRKYFNEDDELLLEKVKALLKVGISPIFCIGELLEDRHSENHFLVVENQLNNSIFMLNESDFGNLIIAYEPVWAIGTGVNASPEQAQEMHAFIRSKISARYGNAIASQMPILYGGSCNAKNAAELFAQPDVDGGLIGGASLIFSDFKTIINSI